MYRLGVETLNHHHLFHFWTVVREGGVTRASEKLNVSQPTISGQLRELQEALGEKLLVRSGRTVVLTDVGRTVYRYADEIFALGRELQQAVKGRVTHPARLAVGVAMVVPKLVAYQILEPALHLPEPIQLDCVHERPERLVAELASSRWTWSSPTLRPLRRQGPGLQPPSRECGVSIFAAERLAATCRRRFPARSTGRRSSCRAGTRGCAFRSRLFPAQGIRPRVVGTFEDSALIDAFGQAGRGSSPCRRRPRRRCGDSTGCGSWATRHGPASASTRSPSRGSCATRPSSPSPSGPGAVRLRAAPAARRARRAGTAVLSSCA